MTSLLQRLQSKPEYQHGIKFLIERMRTAYQHGNIHVERMQQQLSGAYGRKTRVLYEVWFRADVEGRCSYRPTETEQGQAFLSESAQARDHAIHLVESWTESSLEPLFNQLNQLNQQVCVVQCS